jgi:hypothetical protein
MAAGGVEIVEKWKRNGEDSRRGTCGCQWVGGGDGWWSAQGAIRENEVAGSTPSQPSMTWASGMICLPALVSHLPRLNFTLNCTYA